MQTRVKLAEDMEECLFISQHTSLLFWEHVRAAGVIFIYMDWSNVIRRLLDGPDHASLMFSPVKQNHV